MPSTTIRVKKATAKALKNRGTFGQTWDDLINKLLEEVDVCEQDHK